MAGKSTDAKLTGLTQRERAALGLWDGLTGAALPMRARLAELLDAEFGILPEEAADLLLRLREAPEQRLRVADVSRALRLSKSGVTRLVDRLAERGLVMRAFCFSDRRVVYAGLTDEGRRTGCGCGSGPRGRRGAATCRPSQRRRTSTVLRRR